MPRVLKRFTLGAASLLVILVCLAPLLLADANEVHASYFSGNGSPGGTFESWFYIKGEVDGQEEAE